MRKRKRPDTGSEATKLGAIAGPDARVLLHPFRRFFECEEALWLPREEELERGSLRGKKRVNARWVVARRVGRQARDGVFEVFVRLG